MIYVALVCAKSGCIRCLATLGIRRDYSTTFGKVSQLGRRLYVGQRRWRLSVLRNRLLLLVLLDASQVRYGEAEVCFQLNGLLQRHPGLVPYSGHRQ